jgi:dTDP-4-dehydrorhamnose 3,5-epimerase
VKVIQSEIPEVLIIEPDLYGDDRGYFMESWNFNKYASFGIELPFVQDNYSYSKYGVLRGLHYQLKRPQAKLVSVLSGSVYDVAVDIRTSSPTFGKWVGVELSRENHKQLYIPAGFAHGFKVLSESADFIYKCTDFYAPDDDYGIIWNDPDFAIQWPGDGCTVSEKDSKCSSLKEMIEKGLLPQI